MDFEAFTRAIDAEARGLMSPFGRETTTFFTRREAGRGIATWVNDHFSVIVITVEAARGFETEEPEIFENVENEFVVRHDALTAENARRVARRVLDLEIRRRSASVVG